MKKETYRRKKFNQLIKYSTYWQNILVVFVVVLLLASLSVGYALLRKSIEINGNVIVRGTTLMRINSMDLSNAMNGATENYNSNYLNDTIIIGASFPNLDSQITYTATITNNTGKKMQIQSIEDEVWNNSNLEYSMSGVSEGMAIDDGETITFTITIKYKSDVVSVPEDTNLSANILFKFQEYVEFIDKEYIDDFNVCSNFTAINMTYSCENSILTLTSTNTDPQMIYSLSSDDKFNPSKYNYAIVKYRVASGSPGNMQFFMVESPSDGTYSVYSAINGDNNWRLAIIDLTTNSYIVSQDYITGFRFDPTTVSNLTVQIDYIKFTDNPEIQYAYYEDFNVWNNYSYENLNYSLNPSESYLVLTSTTSDPMLRITLDPTQYFDLTKYRYLYIRYKTTYTSLGRMEFFINYENPTYSIYTTNLIGNNTWNEAVIDLGQSSAITSLGTLTSFRFDFTSVQGVTMFIDYIKFSEVVY